MQPNSRLITIRDNEQKIRQLLTELVLTPRAQAIKWSSMTKQSPNIRIGYPGQHLASLIAGMEGEKTAARGNDLVDGSEVKSCSRIDQLDVCEVKNCRAPVARGEERCPECGSTNIERKNDSKWLFAVRSEKELHRLLYEVCRIVLILADHPGFAQGDYGTLRFQCFEIWPKSPRHARFAEILTNYYRKIYLAHRKKDPSKTPAPKNFWPYSYQFYICNPILTFSCTVENANVTPEIKIERYMQPGADRSSLPSVIMDPRILKKSEMELILRRASKDELTRMLKQGEKINRKFQRIAKLEELQGAFAGIDEALRRYLPLRKTDRISTSKREYKRRVHGV